MFISNIGRIFIRSRCSLITFHSPGSFSGTYLLFSFLTAAVACQQKSCRAKQSTCKRLTGSISFLQSLKTFLPRCPNMSDAAVPVFQSVCVLREIRAEQTSSLRLNSCLCQGKSLPIQRTQKPAFPMKYLIAEAVFLHLLDVYRSNSGSQHSPVLYPKLFQRLLL